MSKKAKGDGFNVREKEGCFCHSNSRGGKDGHFTRRVWCRIGRRDTTGCVQVIVKDFPAGRLAGQEVNGRKLREENGRVGKVGRGSHLKGLE